MREADLARARLTIPEEFSLTAGRLGAWPSLILSHYLVPSASLPGGRLAPAAPCCGCGRMPLCVGVVGGGGCGLTRRALLVHGQPPPSPGNPAGPEVAPMHATLHMGGLPRRMR